MANFCISHSKLYAWQSCKRYYYYREVLNLEPIRKKVDFVRGHFYHKLVQKWISGVTEKEFWTFFNEQVLFYQSIAENYEDIEDKEKLEKNLNSAEWVMVEYIEEPKKLVAAKIEQYIEYELAPGITFQGQIDAYGKTTDKESVWALWELKSKAKQEVDLITERFRPQALIYAMALKKQKGVKLTHIIRETIFTPMINVPEVTKRGMMSRAKITTTWNCYKDALIANNMYPAEYEDMRKALEANYRPREVLVTRISPITETIVEEMFIYEAQQMKKEKKFVRSWSFKCDRCEFKEPCFLGMVGGDEKSTLDKFFKQRESHYIVDDEN